MYITRQLVLLKKQLNKEERIREANIVDFINDRILDIAGLGHWIRRKIPDKLIQVYWDYIHFYSKEQNHPLDLAVLLTIAGFSELGKSYDYCEKYLDKSQFNLSYGKRSEIILKHFKFDLEKMDLDSNRFEYAREAISRQIGFKITNKPMQDLSVKTVYDRYSDAAWVCDNISWLVITPDIQSIDILIQQLREREKLQGLMDEQRSAESYTEKGKTVLSSYKTKQIFPPMSEVCYGAYANFIEFLTKAV